MTLLEKYSAEIAEELKVNDFNLHDVQLRTPSRKHFWVARLINHKAELVKLKKQRDKLKRQGVAKLMETSPVKISITSAEKSIDNSEPIQQITDRINELELIIEYLEQVNKIYSSLTYDLKNIVELKKLELQ